jgi:FKBP-type peptidyl-prolyl cis-trans isomerase FklB
MHKATLITACCILLAAAAAVAGEGKKAELKSGKDKTSYAIGYNAGAGLMRNIGIQSLDIDLDVVLRGIKDAFTKADPQMKEGDMRDILTGLQKDLDEKRKEAMARQQEKLKELGEKNRQEGERFLKENAGKEGVKVLPSGLHYKVLAEGKGRKPAAADTVTVNYKGTLIDGTEFDSSYKRGEPATFALNRVIKGWTEGLQLVQEGGKVRLFIPPDLGYADRGAGQLIGPNAVLIFEVELISVQPAATESGAPAK